MKTNNDLVRGKHVTNYGSQSRQLADLADPDHTYFVLLGGQDGWPGSVNAADQVPLWKEGRTIRMPLRPQTVAAEFDTVMHLEPGGKK